MNATQGRRLAATITICFLLATGARAAAGEPATVGDELARPTVLVFGLGSRCWYCVQLKKEITTVTQTVGDAVRFRELLVNSDLEMVRKYRVLLSPTLVFLDADGAEVFRYQGALNAAQILERLVALKFWVKKD